MSTISGNNPGRVFPLWLEWTKFCLIVLGIAFAIALALGGAAMLLASLHQSAEPSGSAPVFAESKAGTMTLTSSPQAVETATQRTATNERRIQPATTD